MPTRREYWDEAAATLVDRRVLDAFHIQVDPQLFSHDEVIEAAGHARSILEDERKPDAMGFQVVEVLAGELFPVTAHT